MEIGSAADWFSGTMSAFAVIVALAGFKLADRQRNKDLAITRRKAADQTLVKLLTIGEQHSYYPQAPRHPS